MIYEVMKARRSVRRFKPEAPDRSQVERLIEAAVTAPSASNKQPWRFLVVESADRREQVAGAVYAPENVRGAQVVIAIVSSGGMDTGRCMQNMMLAAWNEGVVSCPNGIQAPDTAEQVLGAAPALILSFGYPAKPRDPSARSAEEWSERANRKPLDEIVRHM